MISSHNAKRLNRRSVLAGTAGLGVASMLPAGFFGKAAFASQGNLSKSRVRTCETNLSKYLCDTVHPRIAIRLDDIIADPAVDGERTALALMEARCPGCNQRVHPATSSISAVIPKWKSPVSHELKGQMA